MLIKHGKLAKTGFPNLYLIHTKPPKQMTFTNWIKTDEAKATAKAWAKLSIKMGWTEEQMAAKMRAAFNELRKGGLI